MLGIMLCPTCAGVWRRLLDLRIGMTPKCLQSKAWSCETLQRGLSLARALPMGMDDLTDSQAKEMEDELARLQARLVYLSKVLLPCSILCINMGHRELLLNGKPVEWWYNIPGIYQTLLPKGLFIIIDHLLGSLLGPEAEKAQDESSANFRRGTEEGHVPENHEDKDSDVVMEEIGMGEGTLMNIAINKIMYVSNAIGVLPKIGEAVNSIYYYGKPFVICCHCS